MFQGGFAKAKAPSRRTVLSACSVSGQFVIGLENPPDFTAGNVQVEFLRIE
jgi:hypothetical protein